jgi:hypothetical protein
MDINDLQTLIEAGSIEEAISLVENLRLSGIEMRLTVEQKLADTRRDINSVDWHSEGEMDNLLKQANNLCEQSTDAISIAQNTIRSRLDPLEDLHAQNFGAERSKQDEYYKLSKLYQTLEACYLVHVQLLNPLIGARSVFLDEQLRQSFPPTISL